MNFLRFTTIDEQRVMREKSKQLETELQDYDIPPSVLIRTIDQHITGEVPEEITAGETKPVDTLSSSLDNLLSHLPAEATGLYLAGINLTRDTPTALNLGIVALVSLAMMITIRYLANATLKILIFNLITFIIWIFAIGNGPFQALGLEMTGGLTAFFVAAYSILITVLLNHGIIKEDEKGFKTQLKEKRANSKE